MGCATRSRYGVKVTGVTVFLVDEGIDTGPIVSQEAIEVHDDDDWDSLEPRDPGGRASALAGRRSRDAARGASSVDGRRVTIADEAPA